VVGWFVEDGPFFRWRADGSVEKWCEPPAASMPSYIAHGGGRCVLWGSGPAIVVDEASGKRLAVLPALGHSITCAAVSNDGRRIALGDWRGSVFVFDEARCIAIVSGTAEGGCWSIGEAGFAREQGAW